jgi:hypothetical protein
VATKHADALLAFGWTVHKRVMVGREAGSSFLRRFDANVLVLERVAARDLYFAERLAEAEAEDEPGEAGVCFTGRLVEKARAENEAGS